MVRSVVRFVGVVARALVVGSGAYYAWVAFLAAIAGVGVASYYVQASRGLISTAMTDHVSWGAYIANFTFVVGLTDAAVLVAVPGFLFQRTALRRVVWVALYLALAAVVMGLLFVLVDLGRPDRFWHMLPPLGLLNFPQSMLSWDVVVLNVYLAITGGVVLYALFAWARGREPSPSIYVPAVIASTIAAVVVHTVTAFLYTWLGARPYWNTAIVAPRFLASAFVVGPAFLMVALQILRRVTRFAVDDEVIHSLRRIVAVAMLSNLFLLAAELFKELKTASAHVASVVYLFRGLHGHDLLVPYIWTALAFNVAATVIFVTPALSRRLFALNAGCLMAFFGIWVEKGMGLIVPGFVPGPLGDVVEYSPSTVEIGVSAGIWAIGMLVFTALLKVGIPLQVGRATGGSP